MCSSFAVLAAVAAGAACRPAAFVARPGVDIMVNSAVRGHKG